MRVHDIFPRRWLSGQNLIRPLLVRLGQLEKTKVHPRPGVEEEAYVLRFEPIDHASGQPIALTGHCREQSGYGLILTRRLAEQIAAATDTDEIDDWVGRLIVLEPATLNGKRVLAARKPKMLHKESERSASQDPASSVLDAEG